MKFTKEEIQRMFVEGSWEENQHIPKDIFEKIQALAKEGKIVMPEDHETFLHEDTDTKLTLQKTDDFMALTMFDPAGFMGIMLNKDDWQRIKKLVDEAIG